MRQTVLFGLLLVIVGLAVCFRADSCPKGPPSPIIIDTSGQGFFLTDALHGVIFDLEGNGVPIRTAWTASGANNGFLALPEADGLVHNGKDLFGNFTAQPPSINPNGFVALAVYDEPSNGGNGDGFITSKDKIYTSLRIWIDANHDGICQLDELFTLPEIGVDSIDLHYSFAQKVDQYGNVFRYRSFVNLDDGNPSKVDHLAYDVYFND
jgi:hypothetical protein